MTREEAVEYLHRLFMMADITDEYGDMDDTEPYETAIDMATDALRGRKTGKWINNINDMPICNQCGYMTPYDRAIDDYEYGNYCPNCGAKMEANHDNLQY